MLHLFSTLNFMNFITGTRNIRGAKLRLRGEAFASYLLPCLREETDLKTVFQHNTFYFLQVL